MSSEIERANESIPEKGDEEELQELTSELLRSPASDAVGKLYLASFRYLVRRFSRFRNDRDLAEDAVQEAFKQLQVFVDEHKSLPEKPFGFLVTVAERWLISQSRRRETRAAQLLVNIPPQVLVDLFADRPQVREPFEAVASAEVRSIAQNSMGELDEQTRRVVELHSEGKSFEEVAALVGMKNAEAARKAFDHAVHHVRESLGAHFSSFVTGAERDARRNIKTRKSAERAIDLLPPPYADILRLLLLEKKTPHEAAEALGSSPESIRRDHERAVELFRKKYGMTEDDLLEVLFR